MAKGLKLTKIQSGNKEILFDLLEEKGIKTVNVTFEGSGDDGSLEESDLPKDVKKIFVEGCMIDNGTVWNNGKPQKKYKNGAEVEEIVQSLCYEFLESMYGGWENNDGAYGDFVFDVGRRTVHLDFNERYTESKLYEHDF